MLKVLQKTLQTVKKGPTSGRKKKKKAGASCKGSVSSLRAKAPNTVAKRVKCTHWCANMKGGKKGK